MTVILSYVWIFVTFVSEFDINMKLLLSLFLMSSVLCNEFTSVMELCTSDVSHMETSYEGEGEKESKENVEDFSKVKIRQGVCFYESLAITGDKELMSNWSISTPFLEIHSPPPEHV